MTNPLLDFSDLPLFDRILPEHVSPAVDVLLVKANAALEQVTALGGSVIHPGAQWAICRDSEGSPFGLALDSGPS